MMKKTINSIVWQFGRLSCISLVAVHISGCGPNERILQSANEKPASSILVPAQPSVETEIETMRTAKFTHIYVIRQKNGQLIDRDEILKIRSHTTNTNRRVMSDGDHAVVIGTNAPIPPKDLSELEKQFVVSQYMQEEPEPANVNN